MAGLLLPLFPSVPKTVFAFVLLHRAGVVQELSVRPLLYPANS